MTDTYTSGPPRRNVVVRIFAGIGWFIPIFFVSNALIGGFVGLLVSTGQEGYEAGQIAGRNAATAFFQENGLIVMAAQILFALGLSIRGVLPGTGKYKRAKAT